MPKKSQLAARVQQTSDDSGDHPNTRRGLAAPSPYQIGDIDAVNLFNGNLTLTIPIQPVAATNGIIRCTFNMIPKIPFSHSMAPEGCVTNAYMMREMLLSAHGNTSRFFLEMLSHCRQMSSVKFGRP